MLQVWKPLRTIAITAAATFSGALTIATGGGERDPVVLKRGDAAPDFSLAGSDGRTYRLRDVAGPEAVVIAWFPKAFTGG